MAIGRMATWKGTVIGWGRQATTGKGTASDIVPILKWRPPTRSTKSSIKGGEREKGRG